jgi:hypothetical protein
MSQTILFFSLVAKTNILHRLSHLMVSKKSLTLDVTARVGNILSTGQVTVLNTIDGYHALH